MLQETLAIIRAKAKEKKDGVYSFRGHKYTVKDNYVQFFSERAINKYDIYETAGCFNVKIGTVEYLHELMPTLKKLNN